MNRRRVRRVTLAILATIAVALAATAAVPVFTEEHGGAQSGGQPPTTNASTPEPSGQPIVPIGPFLLGLLVLGVLAIGVQFVEDPWTTLTQALGALAAVAILLGVIRLLGEISSPSGNRDREVGAPNATPTPNGSAGYGQGTSDPLALPIESIATVALVAGALGLLALLAWRSDTVRSGITRLAGDDDSPDADLTAVGEAAGNAAERVETAATPEAADNAIYRSWLDLLSLLEVPDPQSDTPRAFAAAAIEAGMDPDDVGVLTTTFEEVRYGDAALSTDRRERATAALRRIEATHDSADEDTRDLDDGQGTGA